VNTGWIVKNGIHDTDGKQIVMIHDILFKGRQKIEWDEVESYVKRYVGEFVEIAETKDIVYMGSDLPDEYAGSKYTARVDCASLVQWKNVFVRYH
jgi:hypothetical protein